MTTRGSLDEKLEWAFQIYDIDGNGFITEEEMMSILNSVQRMTERKLSPEKILKVFRQMDKNNDGKLSLEEFMQGVKEDGMFMKVLQGQ